PTGAGHSRVSVAGGSPRRDCFGSLRSATGIASSGGCAVSFNRFARPAEQGPAMAIRRGGRSIMRCPAMQVGLDQELGATAEAHAVDLQIFEHALNVIARLEERDALDPTDRTVVV